MKLSPARGLKQNLAIPYKTVITLTWVQGHEISLIDMPLMTTFRSALHPLPPPSRHTDQVQTPSLATYWSSPNPLPSPSATYWSSPNPLPSPSATYWSVPLYLRYWSLSAVTCHRQLSPGRSLEHPGRVKVRIPSSRRRTQQTTRCEWLHCLMSLSVVTFAVVLTCFCFIYSIMIRCCFTCCILINLLYPYMKCCSFIYSLTVLWKNRTKRQELNINIWLF